MTLSRRDLILTGLAGAAAAALPARLHASMRRARVPGRSLRVAHLTDIHVQPEREAARGMEACLAHLAAQPDRPDLIITSGDHVMDSFEATRERTQRQWDLFSRIGKDHFCAPAIHALGNHDCWGWHKANSKTKGDEPLWGKPFALDALGMNRRYHSTDRANWHIVCLDSTQPDPANPNGYIGRIDEEQMDWLRADLRAVRPGTHTLVVSHIPILSATVILGNAPKDNTRKISGGLMHVDSGDLTRLFADSGTVRAALSGHVHRLDRVDFRAVSYYCNGAVSGNWWKGPHHEAREGYALVDLFDDGRVENTYVPFDWKAAT